MTTTSSYPVTCPCCGKPLEPGDTADASALRPALVGLIRRDVPDWPDNGRICDECLQKYRQIYLTQLLADETGELGTLEAEVAQVLSRGTLLTPLTAPDERSFSRAR